jgi:glucan-binding YG repeat protein
MADGTYSLTAAYLNGLLPAGKYQIVDGKIIVPQPKNGLVTENGKLYYYINDVKQKGAIQVGDDIYYFGAQTCTTMADGTYSLTAAYLNGLLPAGKYQIVDGKIVQ